MSVFVFLVVLFISCEKEEVVNETSLINEGNLNFPKISDVKIMYGGQWVPAEITENNEYIIEGDIIVEPDGINKSIGFSDLQRRWPNKTVNYVISQQFRDRDALRPNDMNGMLIRAMHEWKAKTGIEFVQVNPVNTLDYVEIMEGGSAAETGYRNRRQTYYISSAANYGVYLHEWGHVLGLLHEHTRPDRDNYVVVHPDLKLKAAYFRAGSSNTTLYTSQLDFNSVMLYPSAPYSNTYDLVRKDNGQPFEAIGYSQGILSEGDINTINSMYSDENNCDSSGNLPNDVSCDHWAYNEIKFMWQNGYIVGDGTSFNPEEILSRAQFAALVASVINPVPIRSARNFIDVPTNPNRHWAYDAISKTYRGGYMSGVSNILFNPDGKLTKEQLVVAIASGNGLLGGNSSHLSLFSDPDSISDWAISGVQHATANNYVTNYPVKQQFRGKLFVTRSEAAMIFYQVLVDHGIAPFRNNPYLVTR
ncbi:M12 family metallopeptidase [uncultured Aquimarina sp.]|uniref:M12 family metallopeptidase n=1 Tax=uncultured Aquimarina sp. TaxID=575652 RepID=UPI0026101A2C|nr:M12 family metallopeptidase [uncultured Aquimarina sp.]